MSIQGTEEWRLERCGKVTASRLSEVVARTKTGAYGASRANYMAELVAERLTGKPAEQFVSKPMQWGIEHEAEARADYEFFYDARVVEVGFIPHPTIAASGASPDGLVGSDGLVEFKCPNTATHIATLLGAPIDKEYITQMQWQMECARRLWVDWVSFDPRMPVPLRRFRLRVMRDEQRIIELRSEVKKFLAEMETMDTRLTALLSSKNQVAA